MLLAAAAASAGLATAGHAQSVSLSLVGDSSVAAQPGVGQSVLDSGRQAASAHAAGAEDITSCEPYGTQSNAAGNASVSQLTSNANTLSYRMDAVARANGGHYRTGTCLANRRIGFTGHDTQARADANATATVRIHFDGGRPNVPYFVKISRTQTGTAQVDQLTDPDGKPVDLAPKDSPYPIVMSRPGQDFFLRSAISASAENKGGCCSAAADSSALVTVSVTPAPLLFGGHQVGYIRGGVQTPGYKNVAVVMIDGLTHCTATLISTRTLLTAAHCVDGYMTKESMAGGHVTAAFGSVYSQPLFPPIAVTGAAYPDSGEMVFDRKTLRHDIAVLYLKSEVNWAGISPAPLHDGSPAWQQIKANSTALTFVGFGFNVLNNEKEGAGIKREAAWGISSYDDYAIAFSVPGKNTCEGDSGGPGFIETPDKLLLAAITSGGDDKCTFGFDTRVDSYLAWIKPHIQ